MFFENRTLTNLLHSFIELKSHLINKLVLHRMEKFLRRLSLLCATPANPSLKFSIHAIHTAFLVKYHSDVALRGAGELEQVVLSSAHSLLSCVDQILDRLVTTGKFSSVQEYLVRSFPMLLKLYLDSYNAWYFADQARLAARVKVMLTVLYRAERAISGFDAEDSELHNAFRLQITQLRAIFSRISGEESLGRFDADVLGQMTGVFGELINALEIARSG